ncbi:LysR family transcriptional regulator [Rhizobium sp. YTU87027]|uniref:LysR family transcriptional regulator n=1 Tax=Rhizobium sp. YTU87027 TaxID=3417741 RepID=UPI003D68578E
MRVSLRHIEVFHVVMTSGSLTRAAELMHTSQPTLSREIATLERLLGFTLFERRSRRLLATEKAVLFHAEVQRSYSGLQQLMQSAEAIRDNTTSYLRIACLPLFSSAIVPKISVDLLREHPNCRMAMVPLDHADLMRELLALRYELGLVEVGVAVEGMHVEEVTVGEEVCVLPEGHPLAALRIISPSDLEKVDLISYTSNDAYHKRFQSFFESTSFTKNVKLETTTAEAICSFVQQGLGVALVNPITARAFAGRGIVVRPLSISIPFVVGVCRPLGRPISDFAATAARLIVQECETISAELRRPEVWQGQTRAQGKAYQF